MRRLFRLCPPLVACTYAVLSSTTWLSADEPDRSPLAALGFVDVTAPPFSADPTGRKDSTEAIQRAIVYARDHQMVCFFPPGEYLVSDTLECRQYRPLTAGGTRRKGTREYPCVLVGSRRGPRPRIVLAPNSPGFSDPSKPKYVIHFWAPGTGREVPLDQPQPNINMNQMLIGIDIVIGPGNPGAVGVRHRCAQGSGVQDCTIDARHGYCGLEGGAGSGGSHVNVTVIGGRIGMDLRETQPAPTLVGCTLIGQTEVPLISASRQTLCAVGLRIETDTSGPAIVTRKGWGAHTGQLCLVDSVIVFRKPGPNVAIDAEASLYLNNVYVRGARTLVHQPGRSPLRAFDAGWNRIAEYAGGVPQRYRDRKRNLVFRYPAPIYVDGERLDVPYLAAVTDSGPPPRDLQTRHVWDEALPSWESPAAVNVKDPPYGAVGDGKADDTDAIQKAIDEREIVFLPKGTYAVSKTLRLRSNTKLIGVHRCFTWLVPISRPGEDFTDPENPKPVIQTADDPRARTVLAFFGIRTMQRSTAAYCLLWRSGRDSLIRDADMVYAYGPWRVPEHRPVKPYNHPLVIVEGHGGGRWYNFFQESWRWHGPAYRHLLIRGTTEPLRIYQCNPEHARSDANMEIRGARNVSIYGVKGEYNRPIIWVRDSDHIRIFGYGGNAAARAGTALFVIERTPRFLLANLVDTPRMPRGISDTFFAGDGVDPRRWHMVLERTLTGDTIRTAPLERPVLYKRGYGPKGDY